MKILFAASEAMPFFKSGGLGDVCGSLPVALKNKKVNIRVVLPLYSNLPHEYRQKLTYVTSFDMQLAWRTIKCDLFSLRYQGVLFYFIDNRYYFDRAQIYGEYDDGERFAFFSKAVLEMLWHIDFCPDIIHVNDWQTALVPVYLKLLFQNSERFCNIKTILTIHNLLYQGKYGKEMVSDVLGLPEKYYNNGLLEHDGCLNYLKSGIVTCDFITTVSPTYANEIKNEYFGQKPNTIMKIHEGKLCGILNGIDYEQFNPATDSKIYQNFDADSIEHKAVNKEKLQEFYSLPRAPHVPVITVISRLVSEKGLDLIAAVFDEIMSLDVQFIILGVGEHIYEHIFKEYERIYPHKVRASITFNLDLAQKLYAGSDILLMPSKIEPCGLSQMIALRYGAIPIIHETGGLYDSIKPFDCGEKGENGFTFAQYNAHDMLYVIKKALLIYSNKEIWNNLIKEGMSCDFSWNSSAKEYKKLYDKVLNLS